MRLQWSALALVCALAGVGPEEVRQHHLDDARTALVQAAQAQGRGSLRTLRTALFGVEATLFHAGVTVELPRRHSSTQAAARAAAWAALAAGAPQLVATAQRYLAQLALSLRPGTVQNAEATLREFVTFLAAADPAVTGAARWTGGCSATATAPGRWSWTVTSSRSANHAATS